MKRKENIIQSTTNEKLDYTKIYMKLRKKCTCPLEITHDILKGKWKTIILWQLNFHGRASLSQLEKDITGISQKMLLEQLNELREFGLVDKKQYQGYPLKVEYFLTEVRGQRIIKALEIMQEVGQEYLNEENKNIDAN
jgi:DNA-binding HxlR family transcriptional regulator